VRQALRQEDERERGSGEGVRAGVEAPHDAQRRTREREEQRRGASAARVAQQAEGGEEDGGEAVVRKHRDPQRRDAAERRDDRREHAARGRGDGGRDRHQQRERGRIEDGLQPPRVQRTRADQRVQTTVHAQSVQHEDVAIRPRAVEKQPRRREVLAFVEGVHGRVGVVVDHQHRHEYTRGGCELPESCVLRVASYQGCFAWTRKPGQLATRNS
jgi:hypothetical protein